MARTGSTIESIEHDTKICMQLKGGLFPLTTLQILHNDLQTLEEQLNIKIEQAPNFFHNAPIVIDLFHLAKNEPSPDIKHTNFNIDFFALKHILVNKNLILVGVKNANPEQRQHAIEAGLAILRPNNNFDSHMQYTKSTSNANANFSSSSNAKFNANQNAINNPDNAINSNANINADANPNLNTQTKNLNLNLNPDNHNHNSNNSNNGNNGNHSNHGNRDNKNKLITTPVRSGQQIYAPDGDITIAGSASNGSELLADGNIHVYGALRGRALAGINNNLHARIFCNSLEADLISIAGQFKISENIDPKLWKKPVQIYLVNGKLEITEVI